MHQIHPTVGQWYLRPDTGRKFEVIEIDGDGTVEIQDDEGTLDEVDPDAWFTDPLEITAQPQYFLGALDNMSEPDEADGGEALELEPVDTDPLRVAQDEMVNNSEAEEVGSLDQIEDDLDEEDEQ